MAKIKLPAHLKDVETGGDWTPVKPGMYIAEIAEINDWKGQHGDGMEVILKVISDSKGSTKDVEGIGSQLWRYLYIDYEPSAGMLADFLDAVGIKRTGTMDTNKIVGTKVQVRVKSGRNLDGEYRPEIGRIMALADGANEPEPEEPEEPETEPEPEEEELDLDALDRDELKKLIKDQELGTLTDLGINSKTSDDAIRDIIAEKLGGEEEPEAEPEPEEEPEPEPEEEPEPEGDDGLDALDRDELKKLIKSEGLGSLVDLGINRATTDDEIRELIREKRGGSSEAEPEAEPDGNDKPDYNKYTPEQLKAELKERGIEVEGRFSKAKSVKALKEDDGDDGEPF